MAARWFGAKAPAHIQLFVDMLDATPPPFIRWAANAIFSWPSAEELSIPVRHIHGDRDHIIPLRRVAPDCVIRGAGHLLNLTHAAAVNDFIV